MVCLTITHIPSFDQGRSFFITHHNHGYKMLQAIHIIYFTTRMRYSIYRQVEDEQFHGCQANCVANCAVNGMIGISWDSEVMPQTSK